VSAVAETSDIDGMIVSCDRYWRSSTLPRARSYGAGGDDAPNPKSLERGHPFWGSLGEALKTGEPQNEIKRGEDVFEAVYATPDRLRLFLRSMTGNSLSSAMAIAEKFPWQKYKTFVDIGAAEGCLPVRVALVPQHLVGEIFDLSAVQPFFEEYVASFGLQDRLRFRAGDFFKDPIPCADVLVMGMILHGWNLDSGWVDDRASFFRIEVFHQLGRALDVSEQRRHRLALALWNFAALLSGTYSDTCHVAAYGFLRSNRWPERSAKFLAELYLGGVGQAALRAAALLNDSPHSMQNFAPLAFSALHLEQVTRPCLPVRQVAPWRPASRRC
jgi:hypothetical protein